MIVKFDHISYTCPIGEEDKVINSLSGYAQDFCENNVPNLEIKAEFMKMDTRMHDLYMLTKESGYPIEITSYSQCTEGKNRLTVDNNGFVILSKEVKETELFYEKLGFITEQSVMCMKPLLGKEKIRIRIEEDREADEKTYLDQKGWGILAFVVDNAEKQKRQLENAGVYTTAIQELLINGKKLKIFFAESNVGDLVELIGVR